MPSSETSVVITSCGRQDLLDRTISTFLEFNTYPIAEVIVIEDGEANANTYLAQKFAAEAITWLATGRRLGQIGAVDLAYHRVRTPLIFHCEDDWEFFAPSFIEKSIAVINRDEMILQVLLRPLDPNGSPVTEEVFCEADVEFRYVQPDYYTEEWGRWHGFSFNPGLRRLKDYQLLQSFSSLDPSGKMRAWEVERAASVFYYQRGFRVAILADNGGKGYARHLGEGRRIDVPHARQAADSP